MSQSNNTHTVKGGKTDNNHAEYLEGVRYWQAVSDIAQAWKIANPNDRRSLDQIQDWIIDKNDIKDKNGNDCSGVRRKYANIQPGQVLTLPPGNPIGEVRVIYEKCPEDKKRPPKVEEDVKRTDTPPAGIEIPAAAEARPLAQFVPAMAGAVDLGLNVQYHNYLYGTPPDDAAARGNRNADKMKGGALVKGEVEGSFVKTRERDDDRNPKGGALRGGEAGEYKFTRAEKQELLFRPQANFQYIDGRWVPNKRFNQKLEENLALVIDGDGRAIEVLQGNAMISLPRRNDPYHKGFFTDFDTASNVVNQWNSTGEAVGVLTFFRGLNEGYEPTADRFFKGEAPTAKDAEKVLDLNVRLALSPITWSVSSRGVPATDPTVLRTAMDDVFKSDRFAALPAADQKRLRDRYTPLMEKMNDPDALYAAVGGREGTAKLYNPQEELAVARSKIPHIRDRYFDMLGAKDSDRPKGMSKEEYREQKTAEAGLVIVRNLEVLGQRPPSKTEREVGVGVAFNRERQTDDAITTARTAALTQIKGDPALLDNVISHTLNTPGAFQKWTDPVFHATRGGADDNHKILGFKGDGEADRYAEDAAIALGGDKKFKKSLRERVPSLFDRVGNAATFGLATPGANRNQNSGIADGFPEAVRERWEKGTEEDRNQIRAFFNDQIDRSVKAQAEGRGFAAASQLTSLDPRLAEYRNGNEFSATFVSITDKLGTLPRDVMIQRGNATDQIGAQVESETEKRVMNGKEISTVSREAAEAGLKGNGSIQVQGGQVAGTAVGATVFNMDVAKAAREAGTGARNNVLTEGNSPLLTGQGQNDRYVAASAPKAQAAAFSMVVLQTLTSPNLGEKSEKNLRTYINNLDKGSSDSSKYADMLTKHARAYEKAGNDPAKRAAAEEAAFTDFSAYFAGEGKRVGARDWAVNRLGEMISKDGPLATAFTDQMRIVANTGLSGKESAQLQARLALATTPEAKAEAVNAFVAELTAGKATGAAPKAGNGNAPARQILAGAALSDDQIEKLATLAGNPPSDPSALNAQVAAIVGTSVPTQANLDTLKAALTATNAPVDGQNALNASLQANLNGRQAELDAATGFNVGNGNTNGLNAGNNNSGLNAGNNNSGLNAGNNNNGLNAGNNNSGLNAGNNNSGLNAGMDQLLAGGNNQDLNSFLAGSGADLAALNARGGVSWRAIVAAVGGALLLPPGGGDGLIPNLPGFPCCVPAPGVPRPVGVPGGIV